MINDFTINGIEARTWSLVLDERSLSALMTPPPVKDNITNKSRLQHGTRIVDLNPKKDERSLSITVGICASTIEDFYVKYNSFCTNVLAKGKFEIVTIYQPNVVYKCIYKRCEQITYFNGRIGKFSLSLVEPNPDDRAIGEYIEPTE